MRRWVAGTQKHPGTGATDCQGRPNEKEKWEREKGVNGRRDGEEEGEREAFILVCTLVQVQCYISMLVQGISETFISNLLYWATANGHYNIND